MLPYILIEPINFGELQQKRANAIKWTLNSLIRGAEQATISCSLLWEDGNGNTQYVDSFLMDVDQNTLNRWGEDDSVIDDFVLGYSPLFIKREI